MPKGVYPRPKIHNGKWYKYRPPCKEETKNKIRQSVFKAIKRRKELYGSYFTEEGLRKQKNNKGFKGHHLSETHKAIISEKNTKLRISKEELEKLYCQMYLTGREIALLHNVSPATVGNCLKRYHIPQRNIGQTYSVRPDIKESVDNKIRKANKGRMLAPDPSGVFKRLNKDPEFTAKRLYALRNSEKAKKANRDPNRIRKAMRRRIPTGPEQKLIDLINECSLSYKYVGNGEVFIGRWNPDFINTNGQKKLIELFGDYWHRNDNPQDRIELFRKYGYETLVIWESELNTNQELVIQKIKEFDKSIKN